MVHIPDVYSCCHELLIILLHVLYRLSVKVWYRWHDNSSALRVEVSDKTLIVDFLDIVLSVCLKVLMQMKS